MNGTRLGFLLFTLQVYSSMLSYVFNLTDTFHFTGGIFRSGFLINGQSPGPLIEADEGDWITVRINNHLPISITIHFHGILQKGTPWSDGVPGVTQYPILSGESYTHTFHADQHGPAWYHSHYRGYSSDGIYGPIYIRPGKHTRRPYSAVTNSSLEVELLSELEKSPVNIIADDLFDVPMDDILARMNRFGIDPVCIQSILINGMGKVYCPDFALVQSRAELDSYGCTKDTANGFADLREGMDNVKLKNPGFRNDCQPTISELFSLKVTKLWQYLNIINAGGQYTKSFSIDDHQLCIIAVDGIFVSPVVVEKIQIPVGSRITLLVRTDFREHLHPNISYKMRFAAVRCPQLIEGIALLSYETHTSCTELSNGIPYQDIHGRTLNHGRSTEIQNLRPFTPTFKHTGPAQHTFKLYMNRTGAISFSLFKSGVELPLNYEMNKPLLFQANLPQLSNFSSALSYNIKRGDIIDIVLDNYRKYNHPVHLHGHLFHVISFSAMSNFQYNTTEEAIAAKCPFLDFINPPQYDLTLVPPGGHSVIRIIADNPGVWMLHCHTLSHLLGGMGAILFELIDEISIPPYLLEQPHADYVHEIGTAHNDHIFTKKSPSSG